MPDTFLKAGTDAENIGPCRYTAPSLTGSLVKGRHLPYPRSWPYSWDTCSQRLAATGRYLTSFWHNSEGQVQLHSFQKDTLKFYLQFWISLNNFLWPIMSSTFSYGRISWERIPNSFAQLIFRDPIKILPSTPNPLCGEISLVVTFTAPCPPAPYAHTYVLPLSHCSLWFARLLECNIFSTFQFRIRLSRTKQR